jgi:hypothetical protein
MRLLRYNSPKGERHNEFYIVRDYENWPMGIHIQLGSRVWHWLWRLKK